jgi:hypothetical protein
MMDNFELSIQFSKLVNEAIDRGLMSVTYHKQARSIANHLGRQAHLFEVEKKTHGALTKAKKEI